IDAAINSGNSGGPAFNDKGKCFGVAFQSLKDGNVENIGYVIIPTPIVTDFIRDYERNRAYTGFPILGIEWQKLEMKSDQKGIRIKLVEPTSHESKVLQPSDVILSFDGANIANGGTDMGSVYATVTSCLRNTSEIMLKLRPPSYYIVAGFVFTIVSVPYLRSEYRDENDAPVKILDKLLHSMAQSKDEELVVISQVRNLP
ncbi:hypothetical protein KSS87_018556, partial [Heliosperma pusillum]